MKTTQRIGILLTMLALPLSALADKGHDHRRYKHHWTHTHLSHAPKSATVWDGNCKVKLRYSRHGVFEDGRWCRPGYASYASPVYVPTVRPVPMAYANGVTVSAVATLR